MLEEWVMLHVMLLDSLILRIDGYLDTNGIVTEHMLLYALLAISEPKTCAVYSSLADDYLTVL